MATPVERVTELLERLVDALDLDADVIVEERGGTIFAEVDGDDVALFIGRHGTTIDAVQHLAYRVAFRGGADRTQVVVDADGYRDRRRAAIERQADEAAETAIETGEPVALDTMGAIERRIAHEYLRDRGGVETHSEGEEPNRHLVVTALDD